MAYMYTGTADDFTVWLYPAGRSIERKYKSGKTSSYTSQLYYIKYQAGDLVNIVRRARTEAYVRDFLGNLGYPVEALHWRAAISQLYISPPWRVQAGRGGVYFIAAEGTNYVKIGYARDVNSRLNMIQAGCPYPMKLLAILPGKMEDEHKIHLQFRSLNFYGEWFVLEGELNDYVASLTEPPQDHP